MLHLRVLGGLDLRDAHGRELRSLLAQSKRLALLVHLTLATPRGFQRRDRLLALFWPELDSSHARNALSQALHVLRRSLGEDVLVARGDQEIGLVPGALECDALAFGEALARERPVEALELYRGDLLEGFFLSDAPPDFERWLEEERARMRALAVGAASAAAAEEEGRGDLALALHWARRARRLAPYDEAALRREMTILQRLGDRAEALAAYHAYERRLREDLELAPSPELRAYVGGIRSAEPTDPTASRLPREPASGSPVSPRGADSTVARWSAVAGIATVLVAVGGMLITRPAHDVGGEATVVSTASTAADAPVERSIAVLPFVDLSPEEDQEYFSDGLTEELVNALGRVPGLRVAARTSSFAFRGRSVPIDTIAQRLKVAYILEGSVRRSGSRLRISVQLVRADSAYELWSETYEREVKDVFAVQEEIARRVAAALQGKLAASQSAGPAGPPTGDVMAFELYLKGRYLWNQRTGDALERAVAQFQAAIARDPGYAEAYAGLADAYNLRAAMGFAPGTAVYPRARRAARQALALDATLAGAHAALAFATYMEDADAVAAEQGFRRAIELNPSYAPAHQWYSQMMVLTGEGRFEEARREMEHARELDPLSLAIRTDWARDAYFARRYDVAIARLRETLEIDPNYARAHSYLAMVYTQQHRTDAAIVEFRRALDLAGGWWPARFGQAGLAQAHALAGQRDEAERILGELEHSEHYVSPEALALVHTALGDRDAALDALERAWSDRSVNAGWLAFDPAWDALRAEPRFVRLLGEMRIRASVPPPEGWIKD